MTETKAKKKPAKKADPATKGLKKRVAVAEAEKAELDLARSRLNFELDELRAQEARLAYQLKANSDMAHGLFSLEKSVGAAVPALAADIRQYARTRPGAPITLNIFSPGGSVFDGLVLYDTLRTLSDQGHPVITVARGMAASMGSLLFLAGDNRLVGPEARIMFHSLAAGTGGMLYEMEDDLDFYRTLNKQLFGIVSKRTKISADLLEKRTKKRDWWMGADEALKLKVATARA